MTIFKDTRSMTETVEINNILLLKGDVICIGPTDVDGVTVRFVVGREVHSITLEAYNDLLKVSEVVGGIKLPGVLDITTQQVEQMTDSYWKASQ